MLVKLAVDVVREAMETAGSARGDTSALRVMLPLWPERWPLTMFWESAGQANVIGREQGMNAAYNGILRQLERSGARSNAAHN